jgi:hypothetical protein
VAQAAYQVAILSPLSGAVVALLDATTFYDLRYSRVLNEVGTLAMTLPSTDVLRGLFSLDCFIEVYRADSAGALVREETYLCRLTHRFIEGDEERFVVGGVSLNHLLMRRVIDPADDAGATDGHSVKAGRADQVINDLAYEQAGAGASIARRTPGLAITSQPIGRSVSTSLRFEYLFNQIKSLAQTGAVDFAIERTAGAALELFIGKIGTDRTYGTNAPLGLPYTVLSPLRGNLTRPSLLADRKAEGNYVYAMGQGQGQDRIIYQEAGPEITDSPFNRIEFVKDLRNVERSNTLALVTGAQVALKDKGFRNEFSYEPSGAEPGNIYREDWDLGDAVTAKWDEASLDLRIVKIEVSIDSGGEQIETTVTDDFIFPGSPVVADVLLPRRATLWHQASTVLTGNGITAYVSVNQRYFMYAIQIPAADGDSFSHSFFLRGGTFDLNVLGITGPVCGIVDWYLDGVLVVTGQDWYSAGYTYNVVKTDSITVIGDGYHVLTGVINGKNGLSTDYYLQLTKIYLKQVSD